MNKNIQFLAYYLPQFHPIPENDQWWGKGFTEWTNVKKAKPLFKGHEQPIIPGELGYYDLLEQPEIQEQQAQLAKEYGVDGFIYYQYWFGNGKMLLEKPAEQMLKNKAINLPFCFCWANETWRGIWHGIDNPSVLIEQQYFGKEDYTAYFNYLLPFLKDERYIKVNNKPMFNIYRTDAIPDLAVFIDVFNSLAIENGFDGFYFFGNGNINLDNIMNYDSIYGYVGLDKFREIRYNKFTFFPRNTFLGKLELAIKYKLGYSDVIGETGKPQIADYRKGVKKLIINFPNTKYIQCVFPNWDNSPRSGVKSLIFKNSNPDVWKLHLEKAVDILKKNKNNPQFIVIKSWNEWAEGNYVEPDARYGRLWLQKIKEVKNSLLNN
jgi:Glycosyltransferase WbsX